MVCGDEGVRIKETDECKKEEEIKMGSKLPAIIYHFVTF